jgi:hypothetical protein
VVSNCAAHAGPLVLITISPASKMVINTALVTTKNH